MTEAIDDGALLKLQAWLSPAFPVGAFSYSAGLETAVADGCVSDTAGLGTWLRCFIGDGPGWSDAVFLCLAAAARRRDDADTASEVAALARVFGPSAERLKETRALGAAFLRTVRIAFPWADATAQSQAEALMGDTPAYPVALGVWAAAFHIPGRFAAAAYLHAAAANQISAAIRLSVLGQSAGQVLLADLEPALRKTALAADAAGLNDLGGAMLNGDMASMRHETQQVRLFQT